ncbi:MAG TPA: hemerythrin domain-containing protein [Dongiaceae bacterium]|jgi:hemerythrin superfamily protein|nr:hemerythrin domain-containing protein [Dongiaceae bacterium]
MDVRTILKKDHREAMALLDQICEGDSELFPKLRTALLAHLHAEDEIVYDEIKEEEEVKEMILDMEVEHHITEELVDKISRSRKKGSDEWLAMCRVLRTLVQEHVTKEEEKLFPQLGDCYDTETLDELGEKMTAAEDKEKRKAA